jgi:hypothetical protein
VRPAELSVGDRVFDLESGKHGTVSGVTRYPMTYHGTYWIKVKWDNGHNDECLESHVKKLQ